MTYFDRDISWLSFNERVLLEAADETVPLMERIRFLSIYSSNLDEFFRVRMPEILALKQIASTDKAQTEKAVLSMIAGQLNRFGQVFTQSILPQLDAQNIHLYYREPIAESHRQATQEYFFSKVLSFLQPVIPSVVGSRQLFIENGALYMAVLLQTPDGQATTAIINIPSPPLPRFMALPTIDGKQYLIFLDDIIREHLPAIFPNHTIQGCYAFKINRDAEMNLHEEYTGDFLAEIEKQVAVRNLGAATRFLYDADMPESLLQFLQQYLALKAEELVQGGRYHNLKDLSSLPLGHLPALNYTSLPNITPAIFTGYRSIFSLIKESDRLLHLPYNSYNPVLRFFNEAAMDAQVTEIYLTIYRVASTSHIISALMSAARNGKKVTVFVELKARFDEENNVNMAKLMKAAGVRIVYSIPGLKVHAKAALVKRQEGLGWQYYGLLSTGNFNEGTARFYTDEVLMTAHPGITADMGLLFAYLQNRQPATNYQYIQFKHLLVAQFNLQQRFIQLIEREMDHARAGQPASIIIKMNNLQEQVLIDQLYKASQAGVKIQLIVRSICCLVPGIPGQSDNIRITRLVDRFLEHSRIFLFGNNGAEELYMGSADWMNRNIYRRIEVCFPVYDAALAEEVKHLLHLQLSDNTKAVQVKEPLANEPVATDGEKVNAQLAAYHYVQQLEATAQP
jgi:polyphosphate kinase